MGEISREQFNDAQRVANKINQACVGETVGLTHLATAMFIGSATAQIEDTSFEDIMSDFMTIARIFYDEMRSNRLGGTESLQ